MRRTGPAPTPTPLRFGDRRPLWTIGAVSAALGLLPWLHTRYAILSVGFGAAICLKIVGRRDWRALLSFVAPAALLALAWFGFFVVVYGTPNPSAPYGAYTQVALAHLLPGLPGLLFDQQFGLLASAPVLAVAFLAMRPAVRQLTPPTWWTAVSVATLALLYTCVVGAYRMWWGGLSAPARFLVPLILPCAPFIALGWQSLRTRTSRHVVIALLVASLALTVLLVCVDHGALAYNIRDGRARWAAWVSPLVDASGALPAAHRDAPAVVMRDALIWLAALALAWALWRALERRGRLTTLTTLMSLAALVPAATALVWLGHGVTGLAPANSQVRYLARRAQRPPMFSSRSHARSSVGRAPGSTSSSTRGVPGAPRITACCVWTRCQPDAIGSSAMCGRPVLASASHSATREPRGSSSTSTPRHNGRLPRSSSPCPLENVVVKGSREAVEGAGRTWLLADEVGTSPEVPPATQAQPMGDSVWLLPDADIYAEPGGAWLGGDADVIVGLPSSRPVEMQVRAGAAAVVVTWSGTGEGEVSLSAGEARSVTMVPREGRLRLRTRGGFRPSQVSPGEKDQRYLGACDLGAATVTLDDLSAGALARAEARQRHLLVAQKRATPIT